MARAGRKAGCPRAPATATRSLAAERHPASEKSTTPKFNPRDYSPEQLDVIEAALRLFSGGIEDRYCSPIAVCAGGRPRLPADAAGPYRQYGFPLGGNSREAGLIRMIALSASAMRLPRVPSPPRCLTDPRKRTR